MQHTQYGHFVEGADFVITDPRTPRPWYNYLFNDRYVACVSQIGTGEGFVQDDMGRRAPLVTSRRLYIVDADTRDAWWMAGGPQPQGVRASCYACRHRPGSTEITQKVGGLVSTWTLVVPQGFDGEIWELALENTGRKPRSVRVLAFVATNLDGPYMVQGYNTATAGFDREARGAIVRAAASFEAPAQREAYGCLSSDRMPDSFDTRLNVFRGVYDSEQLPAAVLANGGKCKGTDCLGEKACLALQHNVTIPPGKRVALRYAVEFSLDGDGAHFRDRAAPLIGSASAWRLTKREAESVLTDTSSRIQFETPNEAFNALASTWLPAETALGSRWARVRHNGYRDLVSDTDCLACVHPELAWPRFKRILSYQYSNGYAPRTFIDGGVQDRNFADCCSGIAPALLDLYNELGDAAMLDESVPFNDGTSASAYEHARRSAEWLWNFRGDNGLVKIWGGDWNDCMNAVGLRGKGTSVWLSLATVRALRAVETLAQAKGDSAEAAKAAKRATTLARVINDVGWDGEWYRYAFTDDGAPVGSHTNAEGRLHLIPQLWAIFAGIVPKERLAPMLEAVDSRLASPWGTLIMDKGYSHIDPALGFIGTKAPGIHENGGIYLHTMCWKILAETMLGRVDKVWETLQCTLPVADGAQRRPCEPYVLTNSIFGPQTGYRAGTPGQSWRCAGNGWLLKAVVTGVFGFQPAPDGLHLHPCLPLPWWGSTVVKRFRGATYRVTFATSDASRILVDGVPLPANAPLPHAPGKMYTVRVG